MLNEKSVTGKAVVIGAGTMGGGIAAQLANAGWQVRLLDVPGPDPSDKKTRNQIAAAGLDRVLKSRPPLLYLPEFAERIRVGNIADDLESLRDADWVVEAVVEKMEVKQAVMAQIAAHAGPETILSSNTSGLSLREMTAAQSQEFRSRFLGTHFLNPPRYLKLLEVIPLAETRPEVTEGFRRFAERVLGHRVVFARDTPGFISTRLWITHLLDTIHTALEQGLSVEEVDYLTGPLIGRPRSATFRMADLVGLDIIADVARNQYERLPQDPYRDRLRLPDILDYLLQEGKTGEKSGAGFYWRQGSTLMALDPQTRQYRPRQEFRLEAVEALSRLPLSQRFAALRQHNQERWGQFLNAVLDSLSAYVEQVAPEIAADVLSVDRVMRWGFGWEMGPFEIIACRREAADAAPRYYSGAGRERMYRVFGQGALQPMPSEPEYICLADLKAAGKTILDSEVASLIDLGEDVACLEYHTKMNTFNPALVAFVHQARERAERDFAALVIGNQGPHFSAGYDLNLFLETMAAEDWGRLDALLHDVQYAFLGLKYAKMPVVAAVHGYTLGAGCEGALHCAALQAAPELYMGLPELNVGVIPGGGGTKEMLARAMADWDGSGDPFPRVEQAFDLIAFPKNSSSAEEARKRGLLRPTDGISRNPDRLLFEARARALGLANAGYAPTVKETIWVGGEETLARLRLKIHWQFRAGAISAHDRLIMDKLAFVLSGGNLPYAQEVSEDYLLQLEREVFVALAHEPKTAERMRHVLATGKPLKN